MSSWTLPKTPFHGRRKGPLVVVVMDGVGLGPDYAGNAVKAAQKPVLDQLMSSCLWTKLAAHGTAVGMPSDADMGNSEVGHNALGAGRVFDQGAKLVQQAIDSRRACSWTRAGRRSSPTSSRGSRPCTCSGCSATATCTATSTTSRR